MMGPRSVLSSGFPLWVSRVDRVSSPNGGTASRTVRVVIAGNRRDAEVPDIRQLEDLKRRRSQDRVRSPFNTDR